METILDLGNEAFFLANGFYKKVRTSKKKKNDKEDYTDIVCYDYPITDDMKVEVVYSFDCSGGNYNHNRTSVVLDCVHTSFDMKVSSQVEFMAYVGVLEMMFKK
jgi:hypothetical protein